jgi:hypothetical protein
MALAGPALQALLPAVGRAGTMNAAAGVAGQTAKLAGRLVPYLPAMGQFFSGDPLGAGLTATATKFAPAGTKTAVGLATSLLAPPVLSAAGGLASSLAGGVGNLAQAVTGQRREEGKSGLTGGGVGMKLINGLSVLKSYLALPDALKLILHGKCSQFKINSLTTKLNANAVNQQTANSLGH